MLSPLSQLPVAAFPPPVPRGKGGLRGAGGLGSGIPPVAAAAGLAGGRGRGRGTASSPRLRTLSAGGIN